MDTGGKIRTGKLLEYLRQVFDVTLISNVESPKDDPYLGGGRKALRRVLPGSVERGQEILVYVLFENVCEDVLSLPYLCE